MEAFYRLGEASKDLKGSEKREFDSQAEVDANRMRRARGFADAYRGARLREFMRRRKHRDGLPLHVGYIPYLLTVHRVAERRELERLVVQHGWTVPDLYAEIRRRHPASETAHGRTVKPPVNAEMGIEHLLTAARQWMSRADVVLAMLQEDGQAAQTRERLRDAAQQFERLGEKAGEVARELRRIARRRGGNGGG